MSPATAPREAEARRQEALERAPPIGIAGVSVSPGPFPFSSHDFARMSGLPLAVVENKLGFKKLARWGPDGYVGAALKTCGIALGGLDPAKVDVVLTMLSPNHPPAEPYGYGAFIKDHIGATNAEVLDASDTCASIGVALRMARDLLLAEPHLEHVLLTSVLASIDVVDLSNPATSWIANLSDGAGAMLVSRDEDLDNVLLQTAQVSEPQFIDDVVYTPADRAGQGVVTYRDRYRRYLPRRVDVVDKEHMKERLDPIALERFTTTVRASLQASGVPEDALDLLALNTMKPSLWKAILAEFKLDPDAQVYLDEVGHMGFLDQFIHVERVRNQRLLPQGGIMVLGTPGVGFHWVATTLAFKGPRLDGVVRA